MAKKEKFGKFVLLEEVENVGIGHEYRAAKLGTTGLEKIVSVLRLKPPLASNAEAVKSLMDQVKFAAQLQNPNVLKIYGIGKVDAAYYISYEFLEGKSLRAIFTRCRQEGFPFSVDHALLIASKICSALEYAHSRKNETGGRYFHGLVTPGSVLVSYEGEVRLRGFGYWHSRLREAGALPEEASLYLAPEQADGGAGDTRADVFAVGAILFETLTGEPLLQAGRAGDPATRVAKAKLQSPTTDDDSLPKPIADILQRALAKDPAARYGEIQEMRKAVDTLLFSGDFTPTTFNLAFFMHSLFREDIERESKSLKEEKDTSYIEFLTETGALSSRSGSATLPGVSAETLEVRTPSADATLIVPPVPHHPAATSPVHAPAPLPLVPPPPPPHRDPVAHPPAHRDQSHTPPPAHADSSFTFHKAEPKAASKMPLILGGAAAALVLAGVGGYFAYKKMASGPPPAPTTTTLSAEAAAAVARVKELEEKLKAIEAEKAAAEAKAAEDAKKKVEAQAAAKGQQADPAAVQKAQEEAAKKARAEQEKKAAEERKRLEEEKRAEEARVAEERRRAEEEAARIAAATTTTLPVATTTTQAPQPAIRPGTLVNLSDPGVIAPVAERVSPPMYPEIARRQGLEGTVELNVLVDERGSVQDVQVVTGAGGKAGLNEAAADNVRKRKYRPATKEGVPVKVWVPVRVQFKLPK